MAALDCGFPSPLPRVCLVLSKYPRCPWNLVWAAAQANCLLPSAGWKLFLPECWAGGNQECPPPRAEGPALQGRKEG